MSTPSIESLGIGALLVGFPKCGTTSVAEWLSGSPSIEVSSPKETFLMVPEFGRTPPIPRSGPFSTNHIRLEASTLNIYSPRVLDDAAANRTPTIICYRSPADALPSWHNQMDRAGLLNGETIDQLWSGASEVRPSPNYLKNYQQMLAFGSHLEQWREAKGDNEVLVLQTSELRSNPARVRTLLGTFLQADMPDMPIPEANGYQQLRLPDSYRRVMQSSAGRRLRMAATQSPRLRAVTVATRDRLLTKAATKNPVSAEVRAALAAETALAERQFQANRSHWNSQ